VLVRLAGDLVAVLRGDLAADVFLVDVVDRLVELRGELFAFADVVREDDVDRRDPDDDVFLDEPPLVRFEPPALLFPAEELRDDELFFAAELRDDALLLPELRPPALLLDELRPLELLLAELRPPVLLDDELRPPELLLDELRPPDFALDDFPLPLEAELFFADEDDFERELDEVFFEPPLLFDFEPVERDPVDFFVVGIN